MPVGRNPRRHASDKSSTVLPDASASSSPPPPLSTSSPSSSSSPTADPSSPINRSHSPSSSTKHATTSPCTARACLANPSIFTSNTTPSTCTYASCRRNSFTRNSPTWMRFPCVASRFHHRRSSVVPCIPLIFFVRNRDAFQSMHQSVPQPRVQSPRRSSARDSVVPVVARDPSLDSFATWRARGGV